MAVSVACALGEVGMITARDMMTMDVVTITGDTPIRVAIDLLIRHNISGIPVVRDDSTLVGIITERDILRLIDEPQSVNNGKVEDFMTTPVVSFELRSSVRKMCDFLAGKCMRRLPITQDGKLVGIVSRRDIIKSIMETEGAAVV